MIRFLSISLLVDAPLSILASVVRVGERLTPSDVQQFGFRSYSCSFSMKGYSYSKHDGQVQVPRVQIRIRIKSTESDVYRAGGIAICATSQGAPAVQVKSSRTLQVFPTRAMVVSTELKSALALLTVS